MTDKQIKKLRDECRKRAEAKNWKVESQEAEEIVFAALKKLSLEKTIDHKLGSHRFPDVIVGGSLGIEVKCTRRNETILGNSVLQKDPAKISKLLSVWFLLNKKKVHVGPYSDLISSVKVDHNPRFLLSLRTADSGKKTSESMRKLLGEDSDVLKYYKETIKKRNQKLRNYLLSEPSIEPWKWFMGKKDKEMSKQFIALFEKCREEWDKLDDKNVLPFGFVDQIETLAQRERILWNDMFRPFFEEFGVIGPIKDRFTAGGIQGGLPAILARLSGSLGEISTRLQKKDKKFRKNWKTHALRLCEIQWRNRKRGPRYKYEEEKYEELCRRIKNLRVPPQRPPKKRAAKSVKKRPKPHPG